ncbi:MAG: sarcosine oxidase subunit gamma [Tabrizicola sp.]|nr:sarcosine oxidase subunit gamma [Tabrizicola sp.]
MAYEVTIHELPLRAVFDLKGDRAALAAWCGIALPDQPNRQAGAGLGQVALIGPDHWLLWADVAEERDLAASLRPEAVPADLSIVLISDTLTFLAVTGPDAGEVMAVATPLDLHPSVFGPDDIAFAEAHGIKALIRRLAGGFELGVERSYADWFRTILERCAS